MQSLILAGNQGNQSSTDTASILGDTDADLLVTRGSDLGNLTQGLAHVSLKVGVELNQTTINTDINNVLGVELVGINESSSKGNSTETSGTFANGVDETLRASAAWDDPKVDFGLAEHGGRRCKDDVAH